MEKEESRKTSCDLAVDRDLAKQVETLDPDSTDCAPSCLDQPFPPAGCMTRNAVLDRVLKIYRSDPLLIGPVKSFVDKLIDAKAVGRLGYEIRNELDRLGGLEDKSQARFLDDYVAWEKRTSDAAYKFVAAAERGLCVGLGEIRNILSEIPDADDVEEWVSMD